MNKMKEFTKYNLISFFLRHQSITNLKVLGNKLHQCLDLWDPNFSTSSNITMTTWHDKGVGVRSLVDTTCILHQILTIAIFFFSKIGNKWKKKVCFFKDMLLFSFFHSSKILIYVNKMFCQMLVLMERQQNIFHLSIFDPKW